MLAEATAGPPCWGTSKSEIPSGAGVAEGLPASVGVFCDVLLVEVVPLPPVVDPLVEPLPPVVLVVPPEPEEPPELPEVVPPPGSVEHPVVPPPAAGTQANSTL